MTGFLVLKWHMHAMIDLRRFRKKCAIGICEAASPRREGRQCLNLGHVTGLAQQAVTQDVAAKIVCDKPQALVAITAHADADLPDNERMNHAHAHTALKPLLPILLLGSKSARTIGKMLGRLVNLISRQTYKHRENVSKPRKLGPKPHKVMTNKNC